MTTQMRREIAEIPEVVQRQVDGPLADYLAAGRKLSRNMPLAFLTAARGTSDQAALYFKYLAEIRAGRPVASLGPSVASVYGAEMAVRGLVALTISQSGGSPDLAEMQTSLRSGGAQTLALLNVTDSPVGRGAEVVLPLMAGEEKAVAATKSLVASLVACAALVAGMTGDTALVEAIRGLPERLAVAVDATADASGIGRAQSTYTLSRGPGLAVAGEAALKLKETCRLHAEAYSAAEVLHGPIVIAGETHAAVAFLPEDAGRESVRKAADRAAAEGSHLLTVGSEEGCHLRLPSAPDPLLAPIIQIAAFYGLVERLSVSLGFNPDSPVGLQKVTMTV